MRPLRRAAGVLPQGPGRPPDLLVAGCRRPGGPDDRLEAAVREDEGADRGRRPSASAAADRARSRSSTTTPPGRRCTRARSARIRSTLGDRVVRIEHTGSTSVPGLAAKPIIDITMIVADVRDEAA